MPIRINCVHADNWNHCKIHTAPWWIRWLLPKGRPKCVLLYDRQLQDPEGCPDQKTHPHPALPPPGPE